MSKKSRRRNKKIISALLLGGLGLAAANKKKARDISIEANEDKESGFDIPAVTSTPKKKPVVSSTVITKKRNPKSIYESDDGSITKGDMSFADKNEYSNFMRKKRRENAPLAGVRIPNQSMASPNLNTGAFDIGFKKGGRVKGCGIAKKGFGRAMKKGRK